MWKPCLAEAIELPLDRAVQGVATLMPGASYGPVRLESYMLVWIIQAPPGGVVRMAGELVPAEPGVLVLGRPGQVWEYHFGSGRPSVHFICIFTSMMPRAGGRSGNAGRPGGSWGRKPGADGGAGAAALERRAWCRRGPERGAGGKWGARGAGPGGDGRGFVDPGLVGVLSGGGNGRCPSVAAGRCPPALPAQALPVCRAAGGAAGRGGAGVAGGGWMVLAATAWGNAWR